MRDKEKPSLSFVAGWVYSALVDTTDAFEEEDEEYGIPGVRRVIMSGSDMGMTLIASDGSRWRLTIARERNEV